MGIVTGRITAMFEEHLAIGTTFRQLTGQVTFLLLGIHLGDQTLLRLEVKGHGIALIFVAAHLEDRCLGQLMGRGVYRARRMHQATVEAHIDLIAREVHILVFHRRLSKKVSQTRLRLIGQGIVGRILYRRVDTTLPAPVDTVKRQRVVDSLVMPVNSQFQRVHRGGIAFHPGCGGGTPPQQGINRNGHRRISRDAVIGPIDRCLGDKRQRSFRHHHDDDEKHQNQG